MLENRRDTYVLGGCRKIQSMYILCVYTRDLDGIPTF